MNPHLRKSVAAKFVALCFVVVILQGNVWMTYMLLGLKLPVLFEDSFRVSLVCTLGGMIWFLIRSLTLKTPQAASDASNL